MKDEPTRADRGNEFTEAAPMTGGGGLAATFGRQARRHASMAWRHLWGPAGSVVLHLLLLYALVHWIRVAARDVADEFEVRVMDFVQVDLNPILTTLDPPPEIDVDIEIFRPDADIIGEAPTDEAPRDHRMPDEVMPIEIRPSISPLIMPGLFEARMGSWTLYNWYYHTQAMFHHSERVFHQWNRQFSIAYLGAQRRGEADVDGSWIGFTDREFRYGPVYGTTFAALTLMVYYRNLPTYQPIEIEPQVAPDTQEEIVVEIL